jgi:hypothetical protein
MGDIAVGHASPPLETATGRGSRVRLLPRRVWPAAQVPPAGLLDARRNRHEPYIFTRPETAALLAAVGGTAGTCLLLLIPRFRPDRLRPHAAQSLLRWNGRVLPAELVHRSRELLRQHQGRQRNRPPASSTCRLPRPTTPSPEDRRLPRQEDYRPRPTRRRRFRGPAARAGWSLRRPSATRPRRRSCSRLFDVFSMLRII